MRELRSREFFVAKFFPSLCSFIPILFSSQRHDETTTERHETRHSDAAHRRYMSHEGSTRAPPRMARLTWCTGEAKRTQTGSRSPSFHARHAGSGNRSVGRSVGHADGRMNVLQFANYENSAAPSTAAERSCVKSAPIPLSIRFSFTIYSILIIEHFQM